MTRTIHGLVPILATPFCVDGTLDLPSLRRLVEFQLVSGVDGIAVFGMASEAFALTGSERAQILAEVTAVADGAVPVVAGVNGTSTATAVEQAREARDGGADALMVLPPYLVKPDGPQLVDFYAAVGADAKAEVMVQDAPAATGVTMPVSLLAELSKLECVSSVKVESPPTAPKIGALVEALGADAVGDAGIAVLGGLNAQSCLFEYNRGAVGTMPACEFPDLLAPILALWDAGDHGSARHDFTRLLPLILFGLQQGTAWAVHKHVLLRRGVIDHDHVRPPAKQLEQRDRRELDEILKRLLGLPR